MLAKVMALFNSEGVAILGSGSAEGGLPLSFPGPPTPGAGGWPLSPESLKSLRQGGTKRRMGDTGG